MSKGLLIKTDSGFEEGEVYYKWEESRIRNNKNVISVTTGGTGSGKSMEDLRRAELSHLKRFNEKFPVNKNCCFSIAELMKRITSGELRKGEVLILEEAGFNAGSQDWQNKTTKMFNYLLQTFRSMNICLYMNLPVLSMLAKQARQLVHIHLETNGIDFERKKVKIKPLVHQLNQQSGKSYWKFLRVRVNYKVKKIERMEFGLPSKDIIDAYENKKFKFLTDITQEFSDELEEKERKKLNKIERNDLTDLQKAYLELRNKGLNNKKACFELGIDDSQGTRTAQSLKKKGYQIINPKKGKKPKEN